MSQRRRRCRGSAITETGPALFLLLVLIFFPMLDLLGLAVGYIMSGNFHDYMIRELALSAPPGIAVPDPSIQTQAQARAKVIQEFGSSGFANFLKMTPADLQVPSITYIPNSANPDFVQCTTTCIVRPFISIPFFGNVPGINAPFPFTITTQRPQEEKGRN